MSIQQYGTQKSWNPALSFLFDNNLVASLTCESLTCFENDLVFEVTVNGIWQSLRFKSNPTVLQLGYYLLKNMKQAALERSLARLQLRLTEQVLHGLSRKT